MGILKSFCKALPLAVLVGSVSFAFAEDECKDASFGKMVRTNNKYIVCDPELNAWRDASMTEASIQKSCTKKNLNEKVSLKNISLVCSDDGWEGTFVDSRDNRKYAVTVIDQQIWMKENLDYEKMFGINCKQCDGYHIYDFGDAQKVCPKGWRSRASMNGSFISKNGGIMNVAPLARSGVYEGQRIYRYQAGVRRRYPLEVGGRRSRQGAEVLRAPAAASA
jgi:hypothetical protein